MYAFANLAVFLIVDSMGNTLSGDGFRRFLLAPFPLLASALPGALSLSSAMLTSSSSAAASAASAAASFPASLQSLPLSGIDSSPPDSSDSDMSTCFRLRPTAFVLAVVAAASAPCNQDQILEVLTSACYACAIASTTVMEGWMTRAMQQPGQVKSKLVKDYVFLTALSM